MKRLRSSLLFFVLIAAAGALIGAMAFSSIAAQTVPSNIGNQPIGLFTPSQSYTITAPWIFASPMTFTAAPSLPAGTVLTTGGSQTLSVTFTPTDTTNYATATDAVTIVVNAFARLLVWAVTRGAPSSAH